MKLGNFYYFLVWQYSSYSIYCTEGHCSLSFTHTNIKQ